MSADIEPVPGGYRLVRLKIENVMRCKFVDIDELGNFVVLAGKNGQGKTSILNSIMWALAGGRSFTDVERPIRDGAKKGTITVDLENRLTLGRYQVVRTFTKGGTTLKVEDENGPVKDQQAVLSALIGEHSFDPFAFMRLPKRDQRQTLLNVVHLDVDLDALAQRRDVHYNERTIVGRTRDQLDARLAAMPAPSEGIPDAEVSADEVIAELRAARETADANRRSRNLVVDLEGEIEELDGEVLTWEARVADLERQLAEAKEQRLAVAGRRPELEGRLEAAQSVVAELVDPDIEAIEERLSGLDAVNRRVRAARDRKVVADQWEASKDEYDAHTRAIESIDEEKIAALERAVMPVPGLSFDDDGLYFAATPDGRPVPIQQCSDSEQLRVSVAIAVALNPTLRLVRVREGSLLDVESLRLLRELAEVHNLQVWVEVVAEEPGDDDWLMVEDGGIVGHDHEGGETDG